MNVAREPAELPAARRATSPKTSNRMAETIHIMTTCLVIERSIPPTVGNCGSGISTPCMISNES